MAIFAPRVAYVVECQPYQIFAEVSILEWQRRNQLCPCDENICDRDTSIPDEGAST